MGDLIHKSKVVPFLGKNGVTPDWTQIKKSTTFTLALNPQTKTFDFISDEQPTEEIESYQPNLAQSLTMFKDEPDYEQIFEMVDEKNVEQFRRECLPEMNAGKCENAVLLVSTFVHNRAGFQKDGTADNEIGNGWGCYDLGLQNENLILKAEELGYGTLIMGIRDADKIREFCSVPETETVVGVIAVGVPGEEPGRPKRKDTEEIVKFL